MGAAQRAEDEPYPEHLLAREPAPPYDGEEGFALSHVSEDRNITEFVPHVLDKNPTAPPVVWAVDTRHLPTFWFPRDGFMPHEVGGYWVASKTVEPLARTVIDDLVGLHARARIELRVTPSIWPSGVAWPIRRLPSAASTQRRTAS